ncbi:MAG TPA: proton-conducting transporter membrane subunit [Pirellulales bacterium]|jgi:multicomponent Na+:H+ antiporter subunit D|nr:proton-conducting transporter membrane subunit [Pirellulales bacterium]
MSYLPALPVALPLAMAALLVGATSVIGRRLRDALAIATAVSVLAITLALVLGSCERPIVYWLGGWGPRNGVAIGISLVIDPLGAGLAALAAALVVASLVFSWRYFDEAGAMYPALMLIFLGAMVGFSLTGDLFNLFVFFELMSVAAYALTGYKIEEEQALMGAFNFAITNSVGAFLVLWGIGLLYGRTGALNLAQLGESVAGHPVDGLVIAALVLLTCGFGIKTALVPFHFWLADAHAVAPTPVCVLFSGVMVELGLYGVVRVYWTVFASAMEPLASMVRGTWLTASVLTMLVGAVMCFASSHLKRLLAFSTVSHAGLMLSGVALLSADALAGVAVYVVGHALVKGAMFLGAGIVLNRFSSVDENELHGAGRQLPAVGVLLALGGLALSGLPPFATHAGKLLIEAEAARLNYGWLAVVLIACEVLTGAAVLRASGKIFLGLGSSGHAATETPRHENKETRENYRRPPMVMFVPAVILLAAAGTWSLWPELGHEARSAAIRFQRPHDYAQAVLHEAVRNPPAAAAREPGSAHRMPTWIVSPLGAILLAAVGLWPNIFPRRWRAAGSRWLTPFIATLRNFHSGNVCDYVAWVVAGVAVAAIAFTTGGWMR